MSRNDFRADHVGSLLRPRRLLEARAAFAEGRIDVEGLRDIEDQAVLAAVEIQRAAGMNIFTDGEYRRSTFRSGFADAVEGTIDVESGRDWQNAQGGPGRTGLERVVGAKLRQTRRITAHESSFLLRHAPGPIKITAPSAGYLGSRNYRRGVTDRVYPKPVDLLADIATIIQKEICALIAEGVSYIQLDAPGYAAFVDEQQRTAMRGAGIDPEQAFAECIDADNLSLAGVPRDGVTLAMHVCRGNSRSNWHSQGGYEPIAEKLFTGLAIDRFLLEYDTPRAGGFEPLRFVPNGKQIVLGLITTKEGRLESLDELRRRIDEGARYVPLENLSLSPQCGFASGAAGNLISWDDQRRKLELVVQTVQRVWG